MSEIHITMCGVLILTLWAFWSCALWHVVSRQITHVDKLQFIFVEKWTRVESCILLELSWRLINAERACASNQRETSDCADNRVTHMNISFDNSHPTDTAKNMPFIKTASWLYFKRNHQTNLQEQIVVILQTSPSKELALSKSSWLIALPVVICHVMLCHIM